MLLNFESNSKIITLCSEKLQKTLASWRPGVLALKMVFAEGARNFLSHSTPHHHIFHPATHYGITHHPFCCTHHSTKTNLLRQPDDRPLAKL